MLKEFFKNAAKVWPDGLPEFKTMHRAVILASLIEKETGDGAERKRISGVFHNRLKKGMLIQCDPTIIYGLGLNSTATSKKATSWTIPTRTTPTSFAACRPAPSARPAWTRSWPPCTPSSTPTCTSWPKATARTTSARRSGNTTPRLPNINSGATGTPTVPPSNIARLEQPNCASGFFQVN